MKNFPIDAIEIKPGVYINTRECLIEEQKEWSDSDKAKKFDFTTHKFWITTDSGEKPIGFNHFSVVKDLITYYM